MPKTTMQQVNDNVSACFSVPWYRRNPWLRRRPWYLRKLVLWLVAAAWVGLIFAPVVFAVLKGR